MQQNCGVTDIPGEGGFSLPWPSENKTWFWVQSVLVQESKYQIAIFKFKVENIFYRVTFFIYVKI